MLKNNKQNPAPYLTRTAKQDQTGFAITRKPTEPIYEKQEPFTLSTTGGAEGLDVTWSSSDEDVAIVSDSGQVTINGVGQVTITGKKQETISTMKRLTATHSLSMARRSQRLRF